MATSNDFRTGMIIKMAGRLYSIVEFQHVKPGKGGAFVRSKLKDIEKGKVIDKTFRAGEKVETVTVTKKHVQYTYSTGTDFVFMDSETYEEIYVPESLIGDKKYYLIEGDNYDFSFCEEENRILEIILPIFVELKVIDSEPGIKGNTATNATKPAKLESGMTIQVPIFVKEGDILKIDTRTDQYVERV